MMKKILLPLSFGFILLAQGLALAVGEEELIGEPTSPPDLGEQVEIQTVSPKTLATTKLSRIREIWFLRKNLLSAGDEARARETLESLYQEKLNLSLENLTIYAAALIREALQYAREGNLSRAIELIEFSQKLAPNFPSAYFYLARVYWDANKLSLPRIIRQYLQGFSAISRNFFWGVNLAGNLTIILFGSILISFIIYGFIELLKYLKLFLHDFTDLFPQAIPSSLTTILGGLIVFAPLLFFQKGIIPMLIWVLLLTVVYSNTRERALTIIFFFLLGTSPLILNLTSSLLVSPHTGIVRELAQANEGEWTLDTEKKLKEWLEKHPQDIEVIFTLGILSKREGNYELARQYYQKTIELDSELAPAYNNLANVFLARDEVESALQNYQRARELDPRLITAHYNLAQLYYKQALLAEGENELRVARNLAPARVSHFTDIYSSTNINRLVIDELIPLSSLWRRLFSSSLTKSQIMDLPGGYLLKGWKLKQMSGLGLSLILASLILIYLDKKVRFSWACERCGKPVCRRCQPVISEQSLIEREGLCPQCFYTYIKHEGIEPGVKAKKDRQVQRFQLRREILHRALSFLLLGTGHLIKGFTLRGAVLLTLFIAFILNFILWDGLLRHAPPVDTSISSPRLIIFILLFLALYGWGIRDIYRKE
jgi:tetratricopeptide (TPR) repeat protein